MIRLAIFDLDGVLTSTSDQHFEAWQALFKTTFDIELDHRFESLTRGISRMDSLEVLLKQYNLDLDEPTKAMLIHQKNEHYLKLIENFDPTHVYPGVVKCLNYLKSKGLKLALASASRNGKPLLKALALEPYFDFVVDPTSVPSKPHPDIFLAAMHHFGFTPNECIGFEDAVAGIESIRSAGMTAIGIGPEVLTKAHYKYESIESINLADFNLMIGK